MDWRDLVFGGTRFVTNLVLALTLFGLVIGTLATGLGVVVSRSRERYDLTEGVDDYTWVWIDHRPVHYRMAGPETGPVMVLLHGVYVEGSATWRQLVRRLTGMGVRVVAIDLPGYGHSTRDPSVDYSLGGQAMTVARVLNELRVGEATVVGHGWGGAVALELAHTQPQFVRRLALVSPVVYDDPAPRWASLARLPYVGRAAAWAWEAGGPLWRVQKEQAFSDPSRLTDAYCDAALRRARIDGTIDALVAMAPAISTREILRVLPDIGQPTLVICGAKDPVVTPPECERLMRALPRAELAMVDDAGHYVHLEQEGELLRLLTGMHYTH